MKNNKRKIKYSDLQKIILETVAVAGVLSAALIAPNAIGAMARLGMIPKRRQTEYTRSSASMLVKKGLLFYDGSRYRLTPKGEHTLQRWQLADFALQKPKKWDKKWRVIIFDIPEKMKKVRNHVTFLFRRIGFVRLQDSVWVYPYNCEDIVTLLKTDLKVGKYMLQLLVDEIENDKHLREEFDLL